MKPLPLSPLFAILLLAAAPVLASPSHTGTWTGSVKETQLQLNLRHKGDTGGQIGMPVPLAAFEGLSTADGSTAPFQLKREAGTLKFEGRFADGEGAGHFTFEPSPAYTQSMASLGYPQLTPDQQFQLALFDITPARVRELAALGHKDIPLKQLIEVGIFQVTPEFIRELRTLGFQSLPARDLVSFRIHGVTPAFIREMRAAGFPNATAEDLVKLRIHGVDSAFVRSMSGQGAGDTRQKP
jgi:hypothetical protein